MGTSNSPGAGRGVLEGAFALLDAMEQVGQARLTTLATAAGLPKTTARRLLEQLVELGAVERSGGVFRMGPRIFRLGASWQPSPGLLAAARRPVRELARATGATAALFVLEEGRTMAAATAPGELEAVLPVRSGMTFPWNTAAGKVLVAGAGNSGVRPGLPVLETTGSWSREAARIRDAGFAVDHGDVVDGVRCVAAPVHDRRGAVVAALCAITDEAASLRLLTDAVLRARDQLSPH